MEDLVRGGKLRPAQPSDISAWLYKYQARYGQPPSGLSSMLTQRGNLKVYVVAKETPLPQGLPPSHIFIVPEAVPAPTLEPDAMATVLTNEPVGCTGGLCSGRASIAPAPTDAESGDPAYKRRKPQRMPRAASAPLRIEY